MLVSAKVFNGLNGIAQIPGDKSISHRSIIISSIANGTTEISNILKSEDVLKTINALKLMGVKIIEEYSCIKIYGKGLNSLLKPKRKIDLGNSGTSARLLTGLLSAQNFDSSLYGDNSLSKRPMGRIIEPLLLMGANIKSDNFKLPLIVKGKNLKKMKYLIELPSAQVKSGIILAALFVKGQTEIIEKYTTRNHTEIMLQSFNANIEFLKKNNQNHIYINGQTELSPKNIYVPCDLSSASFFIVAGLINENSKIKMNNINLNPTRDGILKALKLMNAKININNKKNINGEVVGDIEVESSKLIGCELSKDLANLMIDEYPILSVAASFASSPSIFRGLGELRFKESDRIELIRYNLENCGVYCNIINDDLIIDPTKKSMVKKNIIKTDNDHRIAMSFAIMGTKLDTSLKIQDSKYIKTSFPEFSKTMNQLGGNLTE